MICYVCIIVKPLLNYSGYLLKCRHVYIFGLVWHSYEINQPFEFTFFLPKPNDKRTSGYKSEYIKDLKDLTYNIV